MSDKKEIAVQDQENLQRPEINEEEMNKAIQLSDGVEIRNRDAVIEDIRKMQPDISDEEIDEMLKKLAINFVSSRVDLAFADEDSVMSTIKRIKTIVENRMAKDQLMLDDDFFKILDECEKVYQD